MPTMDNQRRDEAQCESIGLADDMQPSILILGGTGEARALATRLATHSDLSVTMSLAGRTAAPAAQPVPVRTGGFGGVPGLAEYLRTHAVQALIDATHPYASRISINARDAASLTHTPMIALRRPSWRAVPGDQWIEIADAEEAVRVLGTVSQRVFLTMGRQEIVPFGAAPQHRYLIRSVDAIKPRLPVPFASYLLDRGPFSEDAERELMLSYAINVIVAKNSGGEATYAKIVAARSLGVPVLMLRRPPAVDVPAVETVDAVLEWLSHVLEAAKLRGV
jgi:precorrin-6A/cobalt-precorrin-6A reductase